MCAQIEVPKKQHVRHFLRKCKGLRPGLPVQAFVMLALASWRHLLTLPKNGSSENFSFHEGSHGHSELGQFDGWISCTASLPESQSFPWLFLRDAVPSAEVPCWRYSKWREQHKHSTYQLILYDCSVLQPLVVHKVHSWCHYEHEAFEGIWPHSWLGSAKSFNAGKWRGKSQKIPHLQISQLLSDLLCSRTCNSLKNIHSHHTELSILCISCHLWQFIRFQRWSRGDGPIFLRHSEVWSRRHVQSLWSAFMRPTGTDRLAGYDPERLVGWHGDMVGAILFFLDDICQYIYIYIIFTIFFTASRLCFFLCVCL